MVALKTGDVHGVLLARRFLGRSSEVLGALVDGRLGALQASCSWFLFFALIAGYAVCGWVGFFLSTMSAAG